MSKTTTTSDLITGTPESRKLPVSKSEQALASSHNSRINIPLNLENWRTLQPDQAEALTWFHQHCLNENLTLKDAAEALGYDTSVIFRVLKGTYEGSIPNVCRAIAGYRKTWADRRHVQRAVFAENRISRLIWGALDYALAVQGITEIKGESGQGKTCAAREWQERNNHGKTVFVECPPIGGVKALMREICRTVGHNRNTSMPQMQEGLLRAFNPNRILIIDEAGRLLPSEKTSTPVKLEALRYIHDHTRCAMALITTARFTESLRNNSYQFEQILGRIDMPVTLPRRMEDQDILPLVHQFIPDPTEALMRLSTDLANQDLGGRMRRLAKTLQFATKIAATDNQSLAESHIFKAVALHRKNSGEYQYAAKH